MSILDRALRMGEAKQFKSYAKRVDRINQWEPELKETDDEELKAQLLALRERAQAGEDLDDLLPECFALTREVGRRTMAMRHFDVQLIGGMVLHDGQIAEMRTGEGKTLTGTLAVVLNALPAKGVHVVTVNDYLARRDADWMRPIYEGLGLTVGVLQNNQPYEEKRAAYAADITYGTNSEFGFDYLRDNMATSLEEKVQHGGRISEDGKPIGMYNFAIVDEVDNILIDEARTPLIISGAPEQAADLYERFAKLAPKLIPGKKPEGMDPRTKKEFTADYDYEYDEKHKTVSVTEQGVEKAERFLGIEHLYRAENGPLVNHLHQALKAESLYKKDVDYAVIDGEVKIIDEFTGRILDGRRWSEGLHQAVEAKEGVRVREENQTLATITLQNYFRMYDKLAGMSGTALTEATEFMKIYKVGVVEIPTNMPMVRMDRNDQIYKTREGKWRAVAREIQERNDKGQPVLVGTISVEVSELLSERLRKMGVPHTVLNAKPEHAEREGAIIAEAACSRRGHDRHQHGRPRRGHQARRQRRAPHGARADEARPAPRRPGLRGALRRHPADGREAPGGVPRRRHGGRRALHLRHRAPRVAPDRQPAPRPRRPPGRPGRVALLPVRRGRPRAPVRRRPDLQDPGPPRPEGRGRRRGADRGEDALEADRERAAQGRGAELPHPQARPRVRRRDEPAARGRLQVPRRGARGPRHGGRRARADQRRHRAAGRGIHARRLHRRLGPRRASGPSWTRSTTSTSPSRTWIATAIDRVELARMLTEDALGLYDEREAELGEELMRALERYLILQIIDQRWREHLYDMDYLREGIHLRGFAQIEPIVAYKNEAFTLFADLMNSIWADFARMIYNVEVEVQGANGDGAPQPPPEWQPGPQPASGGLGALEYSAGTTGDQPYGGEVAGEPVEQQVVQQRRVDEHDTIGRNDPCWCGSGKKFKKCHGA